MSKMNHLQRIAAAITHQKPDRVPVVAVTISRSLKEAGYSLKEVVHDASKIAEAKIAAHEKYGDDGIVASLDLYVEPEALGAKTELREHVPIVTEHPLAKDKDFSRLVKPTLKDGRFPVVLEEVKLLKEKYGDEVCIGPVTGGPITTAANLRGVENLLMDMVLDPSYVHELLRLCTDVCLDYYRAICEAGAHAIIMLDPVSTNTIMSPEQYQEFTMPYQKELFAVCAEHSVVGVNHICADTSLIWEKMINVGAPAIQIDFPIDLEDCKKRVGPETCIMGNVNPIETMLYGNPDDVYNAAVKCIKAAGNQSGFVLTPGCDLNPKTPEENIKALVQAAKDCAYDDDGNVQF